MINKKMMKRLSAFALSAMLCLSACPSNVVYATEVAETEITVENTETAEAQQTETQMVETQSVEVVAETTEEDTTENEVPDDTIIPNDETGIPDAVLYQYLLNAKVYKDGAEAIADTNEDGKLSIGEAKEIYSLHLYDIEGDVDRVRSFKNISEYVPNFREFVCYDYTDTPGEHTKLSTADIEEFTKLQEKNERVGLTLIGVLFENPADLAKLSSLEGISITDSNITDLSFVTKENFPGLRYIDVSGNAIEKLPASIGEITDLWQIDVSDCGLKELPDISGLVNLELLRVGNNELTTLPDLTKMSKLDGESSYFYKNLLTEEEFKAKLPEHLRTDEYIKKLVDDQTKEMECKISVDKTKLAVDEEITVTVTLTNKGVALNNVLLEMYAGWERFLPEGEYTQQDEAVCIETLKMGEELVYTYKMTSRDIEDFADPTVKFKVWAEMEDETANVYADAESEEIEVEKSQDNSGSGSDDYVEPETLELKVTDVTVSNSNVVVNNDAPSAKVNVSITVEGADMDKLQDGYYASVNLLNTANKEEGYFTFSVTYNAETKKFEGTANIQGANIPDGQYVMVGMDYSGSYGWSEITVEKEIPMWTYTNNNTDKTAPKLNGVQVLINGVTQTGTTFKLKQGDTITIRTDITDDSSLVGVAMLYPTTWDNLTTSQYIEMSNAGNLQYTMYATEYDLECEKTLNAPFYEGEYELYYVVIQDGCANSSYYYTEDLTPLMKEVAKNPSNAGLVENDTLTTDLNKVASSISTLVSKDGAMNATTKANVEAAIAAGDTISVDLTISNVPASSVNLKVKEDVQKKADEVFGEDTKLLYLDINMNLVGSKMGNLGQLNELGEEISITVTLPEELQGDYDYKIVRYHEKADGTVETTILDAVKNADGTLTFKTDRFSTYAIAYGTLVETNEPPKTTSPKTADRNVALMLGLAVVSMAVIGAARKTRKVA